VSRQVVQGPGSLRVGRYIGRLGVVSIPAVQAGLDLDQRVVRRHVRKLQAAGWLARASWVWGEGSIVWLTGAGVEGAGLGGVRAVKSPPAPTTIAHGVLVGWSAARAERRGHVWKSARELALDPDRWAVRARCERGYTQQLPDLAVWPEGWESPGAVIAESGGRREDRQRMILEGWRDAIWSGRYHAVRYDCASESVQAWIARLARKIGLTDTQFTADVQTTAEQIAALSPAAPPIEPPAETPEPTLDAMPASDDPSHPALAGEPTFQEPPEPSTGELPPPPEHDTAEACAERERMYREVLGMDEKPRRRWRGQR